MHSQTNPCGCMLKLMIHSTHGDPYYVGLNGLAVFDCDGRQLQISSSQVHATPYR